MLFPSKSSPLGITRLCRRFFQIPKRFSNSKFEIALSSFNDALLMSSTSTQTFVKRLENIFRPSKRGNVRKRLWNVRTINRCPPITKRTNETFIWKRVRRTTNSRPSLITYLLRRWSSIIVRPTTIVPLFPHIGTKNEVPAAVIFKFHYIRDVRSWAVLHDYGTRGSCVRRLFD